MSDTDSLFRLTNDKYNEREVTMSALVLNQKGVERAVDCGVKHLSISLSASNTHSLKNSGKDIGSAKKEMSEMILLAQNNKISIRGGIQCAFGCRFEGKIDAKLVMDLAAYILDLGVNEISLADSTGMGHPLQIEEMVSHVKSISGSKLLGLHLHNTENKGYANIFAGLKAGANIIDTAFGGLGGCPFIKGATGNVATEDTVHMLEQMGVYTGINIQTVSKISKELELIVGKELPGLMYKLNFL